MRLSVKCIVFVTVHYIITLELEFYYRHQLYIQSGREASNSGK